MMATDKLTGTELILAFDQDKAFLTDRNHIPLNEMGGLPENIKCFENPAFWAVKVLKFIPEHQKLFVQIDYYMNGTTAFPESQIALRNELAEIKKISFKDIRTEGLIKTYFRNEPGEAYHFNKFSRERHSYDPYKNQSKQTTTVLIKEIFRIPMKVVQFNDGNVSFSKKIKQVGRTLDFTIPCDFIIKEYDAIKNYFSKKLNAKHIEVEVELQVAGKEATLQNIYSPQIERIDQDLVEQVKFSLLNNFIKRSKNAPDQDLLTTIDQLFDKSGETEALSKIFEGKEKQLFEDLIQIYKTKHYKHLRYLSSKHLSDVMKLRIVLKPFSYLFLIEGKDKFFFVWETLDTEEATYIWPFEKIKPALKENLKIVEEAITLIKKNGKNNFLGETNIEVIKIKHDYSNGIDGFLNWKLKFEKLTSN